MKKPPVQCFDVPMFIRYCSASFWWLVQFVSPFSTGNKTRHRSGAFNLSQVESSRRKKWNSDNCFKARFRYSNFLKQWMNLPINCYQTISHSSLSRTPKKFAENPHPLGNPWEVSLTAKRASACPLAAARCKQVRPRMSWINLSS